MLSTKRYLFFLLISFWGRIEASFEYPLNFPEAKKNIIERDLENLCRLNFSARFAEKKAMEDILKEAFGIEDINCLRLKSFLEERIQLIVYDVRDDNIVIRNASDNAVIQPDRILRGMLNDIILSLRPDNYNGSHLGQILYEQFYHPTFQELIPNALDYDYYFEYTTEQGNRKSLLITKNPAAKIIRVPPYFFRNPFHPNKQDINASANSLYRLSVLVHESLHNEITSRHVPCTYTIGSCDDAIYGPHGLKGIFLFYTLGICSECSDSERNSLTLLGMESLNKVNHSVEMKKRIMESANRLKRAGQRMNAL